MTAAAHGRVVPRGEHRESGVEARRCLDWAPWPGENAGDRNTYAWRCTPRWRRGELLHAKQRRERAEWSTEAETRRRVYAGWITEDEDRRRLEVE
jgi:hypothetical protein